MRNPKTPRPPRSRRPAPPEAKTITRYRLTLVEDGLLPVEHRVDASSPRKAAYFLFDLLAGWDREVLGIVMLDRRGLVIGYHIAYVGTRQRVGWEPRGLIIPALLANADGIVAFHSHPSGDPSPALEDFDATEWMKWACDAVALRFVDHLILGERPRFYSLCRLTVW